MFDEHWLNRTRRELHDDPDTLDELDFGLSEPDFADLDFSGDDGYPPELLLDVPYVPTDLRIVQAMLEFAEVRRSDLLYDLGCGDGRIVVTAALDRGARGIGIDMDPMRIAEAMELAGNNDISAQLLIGPHIGDERVRLQRV